jgi:hypothetical protein
LDWNSVSRSEPLLSRLWIHYHINCDPCLIQTPLATIQTSSELITNTCFIGDMSIDYKDFGKIKNM